jgi:uncharacterized membrane protein YhhN
VLVLLIAERSDDGQLRWVAKPVASIAFVGFAVARGDGATPYGRALIAALVLSLVGDVLLIPKSQGAFRAGVLAFGLGHLAFVAAFLVRGVSPTTATIALVPLAVLATVVRRQLPVPDGLRTSVDAYMVVITAMLACAIGTAHPLAIGGAAAFYLSDLSVARDRFVKPGFVNRMWGLPLYYAAQFVLAASA